MLPYSSCIIYSRARTNAVAIDRTIYLIGGLHYVALGQVNASDSVHAVCTYLQSSLIISSSFSYCCLWFPPRLPCHSLIFLLFVSLWYDILLYSMIPFKILGPCVEMVFLVSTLDQLPSKVLLFKWEEELWTLPSPTKIVRTYLFVRLLSSLASHLPNTDICFVLVCLPSTLLLVFCFSDIRSDLQPKSGSMEEQHSWIHDLSTRAICLIGSRRSSVRLWGKLHRRSQQTLFLRT